MKRVRAYSREQRKRLIIHCFAERIRQGHKGHWTCSDIARKMDITASTKLRDILWEMCDDGFLHFRDEEDASLLGYRTFFYLNPENEAYSHQHQNRRATNIARTIKLNTAHGAEMLVLS